MNKTTDSSDFTYEIGEVIKMLSKLKQRISENKASDNEVTANLFIASAFLGTLAVGEIEPIMRPYALKELTDKINRDVFLCENMGQWPSPLSKDSLFL